MNKKRIFIISVVLSIILVLGIIFGIYSHIMRVDDYIVDKNITYIPNDIAKRHYNDLISIDIFEYWVFKLDEKQQEEISKYLKSDEWSLLNDFHRDFINDFSDYEPDLTFIYEGSTCYVCVYDDWNDQIITNSDSVSSRKIYFLYDTITNYYVCIHKTI